MDRAFERAFTKVHTGVNAAIPDPEAKAAAKLQSEEERLRQETAPITAKDAVARITLAFRDGDYFRLLQLPRPTADELGRPVWGCTDSDVSKAYRRLSVFVHPDKVPGDAARQAFEHLNQAYRELRDPGKLEELLKKAAVAARGERERREAAASMAERVEMNARTNEKRKELRKAEVQSFQSEIMAQMQKRKEEAARKRQAVSSYRRRGSDDGGGDPPAAGGGGSGGSDRKGGGGGGGAGGGAGGDREGGGGGSDSEEEWQRRKASNKRKKVFI